MRAFNRRQILLRIGGVIGVAAAPLSILKRLCRENPRVVGTGGGPQLTRRSVSRRVQSSPYSVKRHG